MADLKISQLTGATTPLAGTEVLPIVQSGSTVKVSVENVLNYGKINLNATAAPTPPFAGTTLQISQADGVQNYITGYAFGAATNRFVGVRANGTNAAKSAITSGGALAFFGGTGYGATAYANAVTGYMNVRTTETWTDTAWGTELLFVYTPTGGTTSAQGMLVNGDGVTAVLNDFVLAVAGKGIKFAGNGNVLWRCGAGTPEGAVTAPVGSLFTRTDGGLLSTLYVKESGTGNTGWVAK